MEHIGSGALFEQELIKKIPNYVSWEYDFAEDQIKIWIEEGTEIPDMSDLGELAEDEFVNW